MLHELSPLNGAVGGGGGGENGNCLNSVPLLFLFRV